MILYEFPKNLPEEDILEVTELNLTGVQAIPKQILKFKNLKTLRFHYSNRKLKSFPEGFGELVNLEKIILPFTLLKDLPDEVFGLEKLSFFEIGKSKYLPDSQINKLWADCHKNQVSPRQRIVRLRLLLEKLVDDITTAELADALNANLEKIRVQAMAKIAERLLPLYEKNPVNKKSEILLAGSFKLKTTELKEKLENLGLKSVRKRTPQTTHLLLGVKPDKLAALVADETLTIMVESIIQDMLDGVENRYLKNEDDETQIIRENVLQLLASGAENMALALQLIEGGGMNKEIITHLLYYFHANKRRNEFGKQIKAILRKFAPIEIEPLLELEFNFNSLSNSKLYPLLQSMLKNTHVDAIGFAYLIFRHKQKAANFILYHADSDFKKRVINEILESSYNKTTFNVSMSNASALPEELADFPQITSFTTRGNGLKTFPEVLLKLPNLEKIELSESKFKTLPEGFKHLTKLKVVNFNSTIFAEFPKILTEMPHLEEISLYVDVLEEVPANLEKLTKLKYLYIRTKKKKAEIHEEIKAILPTTTQVSIY
jgi:Leucine-rich repeat (LRR) protein